MNRGDAEDAEKAITACFRDQPVASNPYLPTIQLRLVMYFGLFWSAPAKRRGRIEPQRWGDRNLDAGFHSRRGDGASPSPQGLGLGPVNRHILSGGGQVALVPRDDLGSHEFR